METIRAYFPEARAVFLMGPFNNWSTLATPMTSVGEGQWEARVAAGAGLSDLGYFVWPPGEGFGHLWRVTRETA